MFRPRPRSGHPHLFSCAKAASPIPARHAALREALVHASLDPAVRSIVHIPTASFEAASVELDATVLVRDGRFHPDVVPARRVRDLDTEGLVQIALRNLGLVPFVVTAADLNAEPRRSNVRLVWSYKDRPVPVPLRLRILKAIADDGPIELGRLLEMIRSNHDPWAALLSLACSDLVQLDLTTGPLGPSTLVRSRT